MKKSRGLAFVLAVALLVSVFSAFSVNAEAPGYVYDFYYREDYGEYAQTGYYCIDTVWEDNALKLVATDAGELGDTYVYFNDVANESIDAEDYPYFAICCKNITDAPEFEAHFGTSMHAISGSTVFHVELDKNMDEFKTFVTYLPDANRTYVNLINGPDGISAQEGATANVVQEMEEGTTFWEGTVNTFRVDSLYRSGRSGEALEGDTLYIAWMGFFATEEDAKNFAPDHSVERTPEPTPDPGTVSGPAALFPLNYEDELNDAIFGGAKNEVDDVYFDSERGCYVINVLGQPDPFIELCFGTLSSIGDIDEISADDNKIVQLAVRVNTKEGAKGGSCYWQTDMHGGYGEAQNVLYSYVTTDEIQIVNIDFTKVKNWEGSVANLRYDMFTSCAADTEVEIYYIAFFDSIYSANAFGDKYFAEGLPATPEPTAKPTAKPTAEPTQVPVATEEPVVTEEPEQNPSDDTGKGGFPWLPVGIAAAAVAAAAVVAAIIIGKKKKK